MFDRPLTFVSKKPLVIEGLVNREHIEDAVCKGLNCCEIRSPLSWMISEDKVFYVGYSVNMSNEVVTATIIRVRFVSTAVLAFFNEYFSKKWFRKKAFVMREVVDEIHTLPKTFIPVLSFSLCE